MLYTITYREMQRQSGGTYNLGEAIDWTEGTGLEAEGEADALATFITELRCSDGIESVEDVTADGFVGWGAVLRVKGEGEQEWLYSVQIEPATP